MNKSEKVFNTIVKNDKQAATVAFSQAIREKLDDAMEVRKVGLTSEIFNKAKEK